MFDSFTTAPPDPILGLTEAFRKDPSPEKINLSVGVYKDSQGRTPVLHSVRQAEQRLLDSETDKSYLPISGMPEYDRAVQELILQATPEIVEEGRAVTLHTPGGTGALRLAGDLIHRQLPGTKIWCSAPTWPNHPNVFAAAGLEVKSYPYFDAATGGLNFDAMLGALKEIPAGDVVCLHACCHNPSGVDPSVEQWRQIGEVVRQRNLLPLVDFAYQGFGVGLKEDAAGLAELCRQGCEMMICSSFSKNLGLYCERVGALTLVAVTPVAAQAALSQAKTCARANYSNPPKHGGAVAATILGDARLRELWEMEVAEMRNRINGVRRLFVERMAAAGADRDFSFLERQNGMFSFSGLTPLQVDELRTKHSIYIVGSGRINVAGITEDNVDRLCQAIVSVL